MPTNQLKTPQIEDRAIINSKLSLCEETSDWKDISCSRWYKGNNTYNIPDSDMAELPDPLEEDPSSMGMLIGFAYAINSDNFMLKVYPFEDNRLSLNSADSSSACSITGTNGRTEPQNSLMRIWRRKT